MGIMTASSASRLKFQDACANNNVSMLVKGALAVGAAAAAIFFLFPQIDLWPSEFFYRGNGDFAGKGGGIFFGVTTTPADFIRLALYYAFVAICVFTVGCLIFTLVRKRTVFGVGALKWLFLALCLGIGPGLVGNVILKDNWGRARPVHLSEFGGTKSYSPPLVISDQCSKNCSFVAGEASMMFTLFFAAAFLFPAAGRRIIAAGVVLGLFSGFIRISQGAHFLSDVIFAGVAMALTVAGLYVLFRAAIRAAGADAGFHTQDPWA